MAAGIVDRIDRSQRRYALLGFPLAVRKKFSDDRGGYLAATISYYGFFSLFPLLLVLVTVLGYVLRGDPSLQNRIVGSAVAQLPVVGPEIRSHALGGNAIALAIGIAGAIWTGTGVLLAAQHAMSVVWGVPRDRQLGFVAARGRALLLLLLLGAGLISITCLSALSAAGGGLGAVTRIGAAIASLALGVVLFWVAFRLLAPAAIRWRCFAVGAVLAAVGYVVLQALGSYYVNHVLRNASNVYGTFAVVIGLLSWIYLLTTVFLFAAEANVVASRRLWPRPLTGTPEDEQPYATAPSQSPSSRTASSRVRADSS